MNLISSLAIYFILWWLVFFAVLPFGSESSHELGEDPGQGAAPSAPKNPRILKKMAATTVIAALVFVGVYTLLTSGAISLGDMPFMDRLKPYS